MPIPVITVAQMREWEKATWATGQTEAEVIRRVGKRIAKRVRKFTRSSDAILVLAGKGNNGNDARAASEFLGDRQIEILNVTAPDKDLPRLQELLRQKFALIVDGLFGIGLNRPLDEHWKKLMTTVNEAKIPIIAIDVPSGLNCETGLPEGAAIEATLTLTVGAPKKACSRNPHGSMWAGSKCWKTWDSSTAPSHRNGIGPCRMTLKISRRAARRLAIKVQTGMSPLSPGALASTGHQCWPRAAHRTQPGLVTLFTDAMVYPVVAPQFQAVMVGIFKPDMKFPDSATGILAGPGMHAPGVADAMKKTVQQLWRDSELPMVVDASALDWLVSSPLPKDAIRIITPHPGEAGRMLNATTKQVQADRPRALRELSKKFGNCWVVLKGHQTLIGRAEGDIFVNSSGNAFLGQGGSGDVLGGYVAGLLAQPALQKDVFKTIRFAVWQHGAAADALQEKEKIWVVEDLISELGNAL